MTRKKVLKNIRRQNAFLGGPKMGLLRKYVKFFFSLFNQINRKIPSQYHHHINISSIYD